MLAAHDQDPLDQWGIVALHTGEGKHWSLWKLSLGAAWGSPDGSDSKESACNMGVLLLALGLGRSPGEGNGNLLQYSCLENSMDRGYSLWGHKESDTTEQLRLFIQATQSGLPGHFQTPPFIVPSTIPLHVGYFSSHTPITLLSVILMFPLFSINIQVYYILGAVINEEEIKSNSIHT